MVGAETYSSKWPREGYPRETPPVCKSQDSEGPQESSGVCRRCLQILEAGLGISVKIKASPS
jgi:hypothetical protein